LFLTPFGTTPREPRVEVGKERFGENRAPHPGNVAVFSTPTNRERGHLGTPTKRPSGKKTLPGKEN